MCAFFSYTSMPPVDIWRTAGKKARQHTQQAGWRCWNKTTLDKIDILMELGTIGVRKQDRVFWHEENQVLIMVDLVRTHTDKNGDV
jgi:hypothetical protein